MGQGWPSMTSAHVSLKRMIRNMCNLSMHILSRCSRRPLFLGPWLTNAFPRNVNILCDKAVRTLRLLDEAPLASQYLLETASKILRYLHRLTPTVTQAMYGMSGVAPLYY